MTKAALPVGAKREVLPSHFILRTGHDRHTETPFPFQIILISPSLLNRKWTKPMT
jgi:hypothetical protein